MICTKLYGFQHALLHHQPVDTRMNILLVDTCFSNEVGSEAKNGQFFRIVPDGRPLITISAIVSMSTCASCLATALLHVPICQQVHLNPVIMLMLYQLLLGVYLLPNLSISNLIK